MFKSALVVLSGNAAASLLLLIRNLLIARLIPVEDYGVAATFALVMAVVEMTSAFGLQQQIVQSKDGDDPAFQAGLQGFQLLRGGISAAALFLCAGPLARFLGIPDVAWAYQLLALIPIFNALQHFDIHRLTRHLKFKALMLTGSIPALLSLLIVWPLARWLGDWRVMLWALVLQAAASAVISHMFAERPWQLSLERKILRTSIRFGWPLLINSALMFLVFQGDKLIVARLQGMEALALFSMGVTLTLTPTLVFAKSAQNLFLPRLSNAVDDVTFSRISQQCLELIGLAALVFVGGTLLLGGPIVTLLLGEKYTGLLPLIVWFSVNQAIRLMKAGPAIVALSREETKNAMYGNLLRILILPVVWWRLEEGGSLLDVLFLATLAEGAGLVAVTLLMLRCSPMSTGPAWRAQIGVMTIVLALGALALWQPTTSALPEAEVWAAVGLALVLATLTMPTQIRGLRRRFRRS